MQRNAPQTQVEADEAAALSDSDSAIMDDTLPDVPVAVDAAAAQADLDNMKETRDSGLYESQADVINRLKEVGFMDQKEVSDAVEDLTSTATELKPPEFTYAVFMKISGDQQFARAITFRLLNTLDTAFTLGEDGALGEKAGEGAYADVYKAFLYGNNGAQRGIVAVKALKLDADSTNIKRFQREGDIVGMHTDTTSRAGFTKVLPQFRGRGKYQISQHEAEPRECYAMEFLNGKTLQAILDEVLETGVPLHPQVCMDLLVILLVKLRDFKLKMHRDVKPDNIMVNIVNGTVRLVDCGFAVEAGTANDDRLTQSMDGGIGTPYYMAPEQFLGGRGAIDRLTDIYGIGATVYELATGSVPIDGETPLEIYSKHSHQVDPSFAMISQNTSPNAPQGPERDSPNLKTVAPKLEETLRQFLSRDIYRRLRTDVSDRLVRDPKFRDSERKMILLDDDEINAELEQWITALLPHSSYSTRDISRDPSLFASATTLPPEMQRQATGNPQVDNVTEVTASQLHAVLSNSDNIVSNMSGADSASETISLVEGDTDSDIQVTPIDAEAAPPSRRFTTGRILTVAATIATAAGAIIVAANGDSDAPEEDDPTTPGLAQPNDTPSDVGAPVINVSTTGGETPVDPGNTITPLLPEHITPRVLPALAGGEEVEIKPSKTNPHRTIIDFGGAQVHYEHPNPENISSSDRGEVFGLVFQGEQSGKRLIFSSTSKGAVSFASPEGSAMRVPVTADQVKQFLLELGVENPGETSDSYFNMTSIGNGHSHAWIDHVSQSALFDTRSSDEKASVGIGKVVVLDSASDWRAFRDQEGLPVTPINFDTVKGDTKLSEKNENNRDHTGRLTIVGDEAEKHLSGFQESIRQYHGNPVADQSIATAAAKQ